MPHRTSHLMAVVAASLSVGSLFAQDQKPAAEPTLAGTERWVTSVAFLPDGTLVGAGGESLQFRPGDLKLWDAKSGQQTASLNTAEAHGTNIWSLAVSGDGKTLVTSGYDGKVIVWDLEKRAPRATLDKHKGWVRATAVSRDGKNLATGGEDGTVIVWSLEGDVKDVKSLKANETAVYSLAFSPDGKTLASAATDKLLKLWDWQSDVEPKSIEAHDDAVWCVRYSPDGKQLATCGADRKIRLWSAVGQEEGVLEGHKDWVSAVAFSSDGKRLASASHDRTVRLWDLTKKAEEAVLDSPQISVWCVAFSGDDALLAAGTHKHLRVWNVADQKELFPPAEKEATAAKE
jgi:WD40 repeat protein